MRVSRRRADGSGCLAQPHLTRETAAKLTIIDGVLGAAGPFGKLGGPALGSQRQQDLRNHSEQVLQNGADRESIHESKGDDDRDEQGVFDRDHASWICP